MIIFFVTDEFPSPEDWDNEEYTGSLADTKVFTPSTSVEPETGDGVAPIENELKDDSVQLHLPIQSSPNVSRFFVRLLPLFIIQVSFECFPLCSKPVFKR